MSAIFKRITLSWNSAKLVQMGSTMGHPLLTASNPFTADKTELLESIARREFLLVAAVYVTPSLRDWLPGSE